MKYQPKDGFPYYFNLAGRSGIEFFFKSKDTFDFLNSINEAKAEYRYSQDKWSIKQVVGHITDHERIKIFRAFLMSRKDTVELWGYDQNLLVKNSRFDELPYHQLIKDFENVRRSTISFIETLSENQLKIKGMARQDEITLKEFLISIIGHQIHHLNIIKNKYDIHI
jgi:uncharacterized damage-inducible protein DinB